MVQRLSIRNLPGLVHPTDIRKTRVSLETVQKGRARIFHCGPSIASCSLGNQLTMNRSYADLRMLSWLYGKLCHVPIITTSALCDTPHDTTKNVEKYFISSISHKYTRHLGETMDYHTHVPNDVKEKIPFKLDNTTLSHSTVHNLVDVEFEKMFIQERYVCTGHILRIDETNTTHVRFATTFRNPIMVELRPESDIPTLVRSVKVMNPMNEPGKIILIVSVPYRLKYTTVRALKMLRDTNVIIVYKPTCKGIDSYYHKTNLSVYWDTMYTFGFQDSGLYLNTRPFEYNDAGALSTTDAVDFLIQTH